MTHFRNRILVAAIALTLPTSVFAVPLLEEAFNYSTGNLTTVSSGAWAIHSGTLNPVQVQAGGLTKPSVPSLGGNSATFSFGSGSREDINRPVAGIVGTDGTSVYYSCLFRVDSITSHAASSDAILHFYNNSSTWPSRMYVKADNPTTFTIGVRTQNQANPVFAPTTDASASLTVGTTYLLVLGLDFVSGASNNVASLWVNPAQGGASPPAVFASQTESGAEPSAPVAIAIRQGTNLGISMSVDDIRVGTWADVTPANAQVSDWSIY